MGLWRLLNRTLGQAKKASAVPLYFKGANEALEFSCTIAPPAWAVGQYAVAVVDDVELIPEVGPIAVVRIARGDGIQRGLAVYPDRDNTLLATASIGSLCALQVGPKPPPPAPQAFIVAAILRPEFDPNDMQWKIDKRLRGAKE